MHQSCRISVVIVTSISLYNPEISVKILGSFGTTIQSTAVEDGIVGMPNTFGVQIAIGWLQENIPTCL